MTPRPQVLTLHCNPHIRLQALLEPRLRIKARQLARLSASGQLVIFMGSGTSKTAGLPSWSELLAEIAISVGVDGETLRQLSYLELKDQVASSKSQVASSR